LFAGQTTYDVDFVAAGATDIRNCIVFDRWSRSKQGWERVWQGGEQGALIPHFLSTSRRERSPAEGLNIKILKKMGFWEL
jgi:hypothetical protein